MELTSENITIAITVYKRRDYILEAIQSALSQTIAVKVIVVEDCGPDLGLKNFILSKFEGKIDYFRNPTNRGLFDNWNACIEYTKTPWLSILHDDDLLRPNFIETMLSLHRQAPENALYYCQHAGLSSDGKITLPKTFKDKWRKIDLSKLEDNSIVGFVGNLFEIKKCLAVGGFRKHSFYTGDWDMWFRLCYFFGGAESSIAAAIGRGHDARATTLIFRKGWKWILDNIQRKRNLYVITFSQKNHRSFDRTKLVQINPISLKELFFSASGFSKRILFYNWWLFINSKPPHWRYAFAQTAIRLLGPSSLRFGSIIAGWINKR